MKIVTSSSIIDTLKRAIRNHGILGDSLTGTSREYLNCQEAAFTLYHYFLFKNAYKSSFFQRRAAQLENVTDSLPSFLSCLKAKFPSTVSPAGELKKFAVHYLSAKHLPCTAYWGFKGQCFAMHYGKKLQ